MSPEDVKAYYKNLHDGFSNQQIVNNTIDLSSLKSISIIETQAIPELNRFFFLDEDGPYAEILSRGLKSLRLGFYKIANQPFYNTGIKLGTFSSTVYYWNIKDFLAGKRMIKYEANIGPISIIHRRYESLPETPDKIEHVPILERFDKEKVQIGSWENDYFIPKRNFYNSIFQENKIFAVRESKWHPEHLDDVPKPKQITWSFIA